MSRANRRTEKEPDDALVVRWSEAGRLLEGLDPELFESMVRAAEVTAVAVANARRGVQ